MNSGYFSGTKFTFDFGRILVDGNQVSNAELMDIIVSLQSRLERTQEELYQLDNCQTKRTYREKDLK